MRRKPPEWGTRTLFWKITREEVHGMLFNDGNAHGELYFSNLSLSFTRGRPYPSSNPIGSFLYT
jgi:hypothetical protein